MKVRKSQFQEIVKSLSNNGYYSFDTETTGLNAYRGDRLFSLIIANESTEYYFNFQEYPSEENVDPEFILPRDWLKEFIPVFGNPNSYFFAHNAKFDMSMIYKEGLEIGGVIHCTQVGARLLYNQYMSYSLENCAKRIGKAKDKTVEEYINKNKLYTKVRIEGKKTEEKIPHYDKVPFEIISRYGEIDARITFDLGMHQRKSFMEKESLLSAREPSLINLFKNERILTKTCFAMEVRGIKVDKEYCEKAFAYEQGIARVAQGEFEKLSGVPFVDSANVLARIFDAAGESYPRTAPTETRPLGTPSFTADVLEGFTSPLATHLLNYRRALKKANTYYANFIRLADSQGIIHADLRQAGTDTGRFSASNPNLQNLSKNDEDKEGPKPEFSIRNAFVPRSPDYCFVMIDYDQMEYRMMLDLAGEKNLIEQVLAGLDVHEATARMMGVTRKQAKTLNFMLLYGGGVEKLAESLGISVKEAELLRAKYFETLQFVSAFSSQVKLKARQKGQIYNWAGFRYYFPDRSDSYKAPNHLIQGGCAQVMRIAMNRIENFLRTTRTKMILTVHDEAILEVHKDELHLALEVKNIMENVYPHYALPLTAGISHSWTNWGDKVEGEPKKIIC